jgi:hypothetical protein
MHLHAYYNYPTNAKGRKIFLLSLGHDSNQKKYNIDNNKNYGCTNM